MTGLLIIDDDAEFSHQLVGRLLEAGHSCEAAQTGGVARATMNSQEFDIVLCDLTLGEESGPDVVMSIAGDFPETAILAMGGLDDLEVAEMAFGNGALGYLVKPFTLQELEINILSAVRLKSLERQRSNLIEELHRKVGDVSIVVKNALKKVEGPGDDRITTTEVAKRLGLALRLQHDETGVHMDRMSRFCRILAERSGVTTEELDDIQMAAALHDVGKIGVSDTVLSKPSRLSRDELRSMQKHASIGFRLLSDSESPILKLAASIAHSHHENWDGSGYPRGLREEEIPLIVRMASVADVFDSLTSSRVHRPAYEIGQAVEMIRRGSGTKFDPAVVELFLDELPHFEALKRDFPDEPDERIRVFVIDGDPTYAESVTMLLDMEPDMLSVGCSQDLVSARPEILASRPQVILLAFELPDGSGLSMLPWLLAELPNISVIMITGDADRQTLLQAVEAGCAGFVEKTQSEDMVVSAIRTIFEGESLLTHEEIQAIVGQAARKGRPGRFDLSERELEVLTLTAQGLSSQQIADRLVLSNHTARNHIQRVINKLEAHSRLEAVLKGVKLGLIKLGD